MIIKVLYSIYLSSVNFKRGQIIKKFGFSSTLHILDTYMFIVYVYIYMYVCICGRLTFTLL